MSTAVDNKTHRPQAFRFHWLSCINCIKFSHNIKKNISPLICFICKTPTLAILEIYLLIKNSQSHPLNGLGLKVRCHAPLSNRNLTFIQN
jgi:hypothetical protein